MTHTSDNTNLPIRSAIGTVGMMLALVTAIAANATAAPAPTAASPGGAAASAKIDRSLLRRLTRDIVNDLPPDASSEDSANRANKTDGVPAVGEGDDAQPAEKMHRPQVANPAETLGRVAGAMREAGDLLGTASDTREIRTLQDRAVEELDALIEAARASPPPSGGSPSKPKPDGQQPPPGDPQPGQPQQAGQTGTQAGTASSMNTDADAEAARSTQQAQQWIERVWGNLPQRQREQLRQFGTDVFLPGYEAMIEEYFKRLAEEADK